MPTVPDCFHYEFAGSVFICMNVSVRHRAVDCMRIGLGIIGFYLYCFVSAIWLDLPERVNILFSKPLF